MFINKQNLPVLLLSVLVALLLIAFLFKNSLNQFISEKMQEQAPSGKSELIENDIQLQYNYSKNGRDFEFTLIEFGSTGCVACKQMEPVLEEIRNSEKVKVNVVFFHIMKHENQEIMRFYGISAVPMQILLDKNGKEFFRHYGFIPAEELLLKLNV